MHDIQHCFICRPSDSTVTEDAGIEPRVVANTVLAVRRSNHSARSHPLSARSHPPQLDLIHNQLDLIHNQLDLIQLLGSCLIDFLVPYKAVLRIRDLFWYGSGSADPYL
jgi:hypothetical protein